MIAMRHSVALVSDETAQYYGCTPVKMTMGGNTNTPYVTDDGILVLSNSNGTEGSGRADLPFVTPEWNAPFEVVVKVNWKDRSGYYGILGQLGNDDGFTPFWYNYGCVSYMKNVGWPITWDGGGTVFVEKPTNQSQLLAMRYDGLGGYDVGVYEQGEFRLKKHKSSGSTVPGGGVLNIGSNRGFDSCLYADVDLNFCYIRFDNELLWEGTKGSFKRVHILSNLNGGGA